jgi:diguanylate cyclase (GGDEF)-like protein
VTLSFGIAAYPASGDSGEELIRAADAALYEAKRGGRDRCVVAGGAERVKAARG